MDQELTVLVAHFKLIFDTSSTPTASNSFKSSPAMVKELMVKCYLFPFEYWHFFFNRSILSLSGRSSFSLALFPTNVASDNQRWWGSFFSKSIFSARIVGVCSWNYGAFDEERSCGYQLLRCRHSRCQTHYLQKWQSCHHQLRNLIYDAEEWASCMEPSDLKCL